MYIVELIIKYLQERKNPKLPDEMLSDELEVDDYEKCKHILIPIDSTKEVLACSKCGFVVKKHDLEKNKNFFAGD